MPPNIFKYGNEGDKMTYDLIVYVDNLRTIRKLLEHSWTIGRRVSSILEYLGIQDTTRKRRIGNGPWTCGIYGTLNK